MQAPAPSRLIEGGIPTEATVAHVLVSKYADHLPLYRQSQIYARQGVNLDRSTLADWVGKAAFLFRPIHERLFERLKASGKLFADETTARCSIPDAAAPRPANCSLMQGRSLLDPYAYLADVITRIVAGHPQSKLDDLRPWAYAPEPLKAGALRTAL